MPTLIQITDCHLTQGEEEILGVNTRQSFNAVLKLIESENDDISLLLATGDISQDGSAESYRAFLASVAGTAKAVAWLPGNHDVTEVMHNQSASWLEPARSIGLENWRIILLDSHVPDQVHGFISESELLACAAELKNCTEQHILIALHHHLLPVNSVWMDKLDVHNSEALRSLLAEEPRVRGVVCGHIHQEMEWVENGIRYLGSPSSCFQFKPGSVTFDVDDKQPGYRSINLLPDGSIESAVSRLTDQRFRSVKVAKKH